MKKKNYEKPQVEIIEVKQTEIICTSTQTDENYFGIQSGTGYTEEGW